MTGFDLSGLPDLLARLDQEAAAPLYSHDDLVELHECCAESATAIHALMAELELLTATQAACDSGSCEEDGCQRKDLSGYRARAEKWVDEFHAAIDKLNSVVAAEREECARVCDAQAQLAEELLSGTTYAGPAVVSAKKCAAKIRARGIA